MKRAGIFIAFILCFTRLVGQERQVEGIVFDRDSKARLSRVYFYNLRTHKGFYNTAKGEFSAKVLTGDTLVVALSGYHIDTITIQKQAVVLVYLRRTSIQLRPVDITDTVGTPAERYARTQREYKDIYRKGNTEDIFQVGGANGTGGAGLGIDAIWSLLSREGKNARNLQKILERDYRDMIIRYRYNPSVVSRVTGLTGPDLVDFMSQYKPTYYFILEANDYVLIDFIQKAYQQYKRAPAAYRLPPLNPDKN